MLDLVIFGCGGLGREVADIVDAINAVEPTWRLVGLADDNPSPEDIERLARTEHSVLRRPDYELLAVRPVASSPIGSRAWAGPRPSWFIPRLPPAPMSNLVLALSCVLEYVSRRTCASGGTSS